MELEKTVSNILKETFNRPYRWKIVTNQHDIIIGEFKSEGDTIEVRFEKVGENDWNIDFMGKQSLYATSDLGDEFRVFATVIDSIRWFIREKNPRSFLFSAIKEGGDSRSSLYDRMTKKFANNINYRLNTHESSIEKVYEFEAI